MAHWHILGAGAMGCLFAAQLARRGIRVTLLLRSQAAGEIDIELQGVSGRWMQAVNTDACASSGNISHLLVMTKAYDVAAAVATVAHRLQPSALVLLMPNGIGFARELSEAYPRLNIALGTTTEGAYRRGRWQLQHAGSGVTRIGLPGQSCAPQWFDDWQLSLPECQWDPDITAAVWRKLGINCVINPLTALHRCLNGALAENQKLTAQAQALCREIALIGNAAGQGAALAGLEREVFNVIHSTAQNRSSMLQDLEAGRRTEIDYINGYADRVARQFDVDTPLNREILRAISELEQHRKDRA